MSLCPPSVLVVSVGSHSTLLLRDEVLGQLSRDLTTGDREPGLRKPEQTREGIFGIGG